MKLLIVTSRTLYLFVNNQIDFVEDRKVVFCLSRQFVVLDYILVDSNYSLFVLSFKNQTRFCEDFE